MSDLLLPGGDLILSTINRTLKAYLAAIVGAEYILGLLPKGTHDYAKLIRPSELDAWLRRCGLEVLDVAGVTYLPWLERCSISNDCSINYLVHARRPA